MSFYRDFNDKKAYETWNTRTPLLIDAFDVVPFSRAGGAIVCGLNLQNPLTDEQQAQLKRALAHHMVLIFRQQDIDASAHKRLTRYFGTIHQHTSNAIKVLGGDPDILSWKTGKDSRFTAGEVWHNDVSCEKAPITASVVRITKTPLHGGGDTLFINTHLAYQSLSCAFASWIKTLHAEHSGEEGWTNGYGKDPDPNKQFAISEHPVVIAHPVTGLPHLFINRAFTTKILGLTRHESNAVLELLHRHLETSMALQIRVNWEPGTLVIWDNWAVCHQATWDYYPEERWGERISAVSGEIPKPFMA